MKNNLRGCLSGFTLIELLVVVLIIGILAGVALPQYQKAVAKSRAAQLYTAVSAVATAAHSYEMANGEWPDNFEVLDVDLPLQDKTGTACALAIGSGITKKEGKGYAIVIGKSPNRWNDVFGVFTEGKYPCTGVAYIKDTSGAFDGNTLYCVEYTGNAVSIPDTTRGRFCSKVMGKQFVRALYDYDWFE
ncbi:type IV pilin protein [Candidatus Avelusimicrobium luingense]|uniref:type IV pilin protein n=1 Tax=Candidatus Avelusimicrobium luingense TaxID=3416211 RepID=UPI003D13D25D